MGRLRLMVEGEYALFTRPEFKVERVSYDVPTPGAIEGLLKSIYWKPSIRYIIDKIVVFNPVETMSIRRNEVKNKVNPHSKDPSIYTSENRTQRNSIILRNVKYGIEFRIELTGYKDDGGQESYGKHEAIFTRRVINGQSFRTPCLGCSEYPVDKFYMVHDFLYTDVSRAFKGKDIDLGWMEYHVVFDDCGVPINKDWENPVFSDKAKTEYYRPHLIDGVIDIAKYRGEKVC